MRLRRVVDYFLVVGHGSTLTPIDDPHGGGSTDDDADDKPRAVTLTPGVANAAAMARAAAALPRPKYLDRLYAGDVMCRFPLVDHASVPFPAGIAMFCIPDSIRLTQSVSALPHLHYFAATQGDGHRLYGACLQFWESVPQELVDQLEETDRKAQQARLSLGGSGSGSGGANGSREATLTTAAAAEHSVSTSTYEHDPDPERSTKTQIHTHSRSPSPKPAGIDTSAAEPASSNAAAVAGATSPPRPQRGLVTLSSFPAVAVAAGAAPLSSSSSATPRAASASTSGPPSTTFANLSLNTAMEPTTRASSVSVPASNLVAPSPSNNSRFKKKGRPSVYAPKCICLLSLHPYLEQYRIFLTELYRLSLTPSLLPLERYISNFMLEVPLPPMGSLRYAYTISNRTLFFANNPPNNPLAYQNHSAGGTSQDSRASRILTLFELLDVENILFIIECLLGEKRILFLSNRLSLLTMVAEIFLHLLYPFVWSHVYIPLLPKALIDFLFAPMPFIIGMHSHYVRGQLQGEMLVDLVVVDLDHNKVHFNNAAHVAPTGNTVKDLNQPGGMVHHFLPAKERKKLKEQLKPFQALFSSNGMGQHAGGPATATAAAAGASSTATATGAAMSASSASRAPSHQAYQLRLLDELDLAFPNAPHPDELDAIAEYAALVSELRGSEDQISLAFFRCFVSMFKDYAECLIYPTASNPTPDPCFDVKRFLKKTNEKSSEGFFTAFAATQAFQRFCEERIYLDQKHTFDPNTPEGAAAAAAAAAAASGRAVGQSLSPQEASRYAILFFDESILAKRNRSKFSKNIPTPFLEETKWDIKTTVKVPEPETCGMPPPTNADAGGVMSPTAAGGAGSSKPRLKPYTFSYDHFPSKFEDKWFWGERLQPPQPPAAKSKADKKGPSPAAGAATTDGTPAACGEKDAAVSVSSSSVSPVIPARPALATRPGLARVSSLPHSGASATRTVVVASPRQSINLGGAHGSLVPAGPVASTPPALVVEATWFHVLSVVASEQRSLALLQLGLGFLRRRVHEVVRARAKLQAANGGQAWNTAAPGAPIAPHLAPPCEEVFHRLMRCCGSCGAPDLAIDIFHLMLLLDEFAAVADSAQMFHALLNIFAETRDQRGFDALAKLKKVSREQLVAAVAASQPPPPVSPRPTAAQLRSLAQQAQAQSPSSALELTTPPMSPLSVLSPHSPAVMATPGDASGAGAISPPQRSALSITASRNINLSPSLTQHTLAVPGAAGDEDGMLVETMSPRTATSASPRRHRKLSRSVDYSSPMRPNAVASGASVRAANNKLQELGGVDEFAAASTDSVALDALALITASAGFGSAFPAASAAASASSVSVARTADDPLMAGLHLAQFRAAFPGLTIELTESCPECHAALSDSQVRRGWNTADEDDYTTACPQCGERFVARFIVRPLEEDAAATSAAESKLPSSPAGLPEGHISVSAARAFSAPVPLALVVSWLSLIGVVPCCVVCFAVRVSSSSRSPQAVVALSVRVRRLSAAVPLVSQVAHLLESRLVVEQFRTHGGLPPKPREMGESGTEHCGGEQETGGSSAADDQQRYWHSGGCSSDCSGSLGWQHRQFGSIHFADVLLLVVVQ